MYLKIMGWGDLPDSDPTKTFQLLGDVEHVTFHRYIEADDLGHKVGDVEAIVWRKDRGCEFHPVYANAYVLNDSGKTISSFGTG